MSRRGSYSSETTLAGNDSDFVDGSIQTASAGGTGAAGSLLSPSASLQPSSAVSTSGLDPETDAQTQRKVKDYLQKLDEHLYRNFGIFHSKANQDALTKVSKEMSPLHQTLTFCLFLPFQPSTGDRYQLRLLSSSMTDRQFLEFAWKHHKSKSLSSTMLSGNLELANSAHAIWTLVCPGRVQAARVSDGLYERSTMFPEIVVAEDGSFRAG